MSLPTYEIGAAFWLTERWGVAVRRVAAPGDDLRDPASRFDGATPIDAGAGNLRYATVTARYRRFLGHAHGEEAFVEVLAQLRRWSLRHADQGPVSLGYRLGHLDNEPRVFRAIVYNKSALTLHMLRRLVGDDAFFRGLRRFYNAMRFRSAGADDLIRAFEAEAGRPLGDFFDRWIHEFDLPDVRFDHRTEPNAADPEATDVVLRFRQNGKLFELPVTVTLAYRSGEEESVVVPVAGRATELRVPLKGSLRDVRVNRDHAALAEIRR